MSQPRRTTITYDAEGNVAGIEHIAVRIGTEDFGAGPEPAERPINDNLSNPRIGAATKAAVADFLNALEVDMAADRQRIAVARQEEADRAAAEAERAAKAAADAAAKAAE